MPVVSARTLAIRIFGAVPTIVTIPPSIAENAIGISTAETGVLLRRHSCSATGMNTARAPTFLVTIDRPMQQADSTGTWIALVFNFEMIGRIANSTTPDRAMAELTTRAAPMMTTTSSEKPSNACLAGMMPTIKPIPSDVSATRS